jgi:hypothetical protein
MVIMTFIVISVVLLLAVGLYVVGNIILEIENGFVYFAWGMIAFLICVAAYLSYAVPSFATNTTPVSASTKSATAPKTSTDASTAPAAQQQETEINLLQ